MSRWQGKPYFKDRPGPPVREKEVFLEKVKDFLTTGQLPDDHPIHDESIGPGPDDGTVQGETC